MTELAGIRENICHPESTIELSWLLDRNIPVTGSIIDSAEPWAWEIAQAVIADRFSVGIRTHLCWNSEGAGTGAWPAPGSLQEQDYLDRWDAFISGCPRGAVISATAGNEGTTEGWVDTNGDPLTIRTLARTARVFAPRAVAAGVQPWATSIHTAPADAIRLARAVSGLTFGVPYHPYFRSLRGLPSTPEAHGEGLPGVWRFGTVEGVLEEFAGEGGYPSDVALIFDEMGCPTELDAIGEVGQAHYVEGCVMLDHPLLTRLWYFAGTRGTVPDSQLAQGWDFYIIGQPQGLAEAAFYNPVPDPGTGNGNGGGHVAGKYPEAALESYWHSIYPDIAFDISSAPAGLGICRHWAEDPFKYGPPVSKEADEGNGNAIQLFARNVHIRWTPQGPEDVNG